MCGLYATFCSLGHHSAAVLKYGMEVPRVYTPKMRLHSHSYTCSDRTKLNVDGRSRLISELFIGRRKAVRAFLSAIYMPVLIIVQRGRVCSNRWRRCMVRLYVYQTCEALRHRHALHHPFLACDRHCEGAGNIGTRGASAANRPN